jgi:Fe-S cluster assembly protein SufB
MTINDKRKISPHGETTPDLDIRDDIGNFHYPSNYQFDAGVGLNEQTIDYICDVKGEAEWVRDFRKKALKTFLDKPHADPLGLEGPRIIDFDKIRYYLSQGQKPTRSWDEVPDEVKETFERLGIPEKERKFLAGVEAQFDSEAPTRT